MAILTLKRLLGTSQEGAIRIYTDGAIRPSVGLSGLGVIILDRQGNVLTWITGRAGRLTNNEAEYEAVILALEHLVRLQPSKATIFSDSLVVIDQVQGRAATHAPGLRQQLARVRALMGRLPPVSFQHVPRKRNRLADALANDVADGYVREGTGK
jgi:ribonuclease HI